MTQSSKLFQRCDLSSKLLDCQSAILGDIVIGFDFRDGDFFCASYSQQNVFSLLLIS